MRIRTLLAVALVLALAACTSTPDSTPPEADPTVDTTTAAPAPTEGPVDQPAVWPDGITVTLDRVEEMPRSLGADTPADRAILRVTLTISNGTDRPLPLDDRRVTTVLHGPNRGEGESEAGYEDDDPATALQSDKPQRVAAGQQLAVVESSTLPASALGGPLAVQVRLSPLESDEWRELFTFVDVEGMLARQ